MENLCHTLTGIVLARAGLDRSTPLATATLVIASNMPDLDIVTLWWGDLAYLEHHRGVTHSLAGLALQGPILAGAMMAFDWGVRRRWKPDVLPAVFSRLVMVALIGLFAHLLLDWTNTYGIKPLVPFDGTWFYGDLVFIVDPWLWLMLGGALYVGARQVWTTNIVWGLLFAAMSAAVAFSLAMPPSEGAGPVAVAVWAILLAALLTLRAKGGNLPARAPARVAIVAVVVYWGCLGIAKFVALRAVEGAHAEQGAAAVVSPTLMRPDRWRGLAVTEAEIRTSQVLIGREVVQQTIHRRNLDDPRVQAALRTCPGSVALAFNRLLFAEIRESEKGEGSVALRDARFSNIPGGGDFATTVVPMDAAGQPVTSDGPCPRSVWPW